MSAERTPALADAPPAVHSGPPRGGGRHDERGATRALVREPLVAALAYAVAGWPVLALHTPTIDGACSCGGRPCPAVGKHPRTRHGLKDASTNAAQIAAWWRTWPDANVGVRTGALVVVDVDGPDGLRALKQLQGEHGRLPRTRIARTSRGWHLYFLAGRHPVASSAGRLGPGLDVRADGGYIVAPPSRHASGHAYTWTSTLQPAQLPDWLGECLTPSASPPRAALPAPVADATGPRAQRYLERALTGELATLARPAPRTRNDTLNRVAFRLGQLVGAGLGEPEVIAEVLLASARAIGLGEREARATIASGLSAGQRHPRRITPP